MLFKGVRLKLRETRGQMLDMGFCRSPPPRRAADGTMFSAIQITTSAPISKKPPATLSANSLSVCPATRLPSSPHPNGCPFSVPHCPQVNDLNERTTDDENVACSFPGSITGFAKHQRDRKVFWRAFVIQLISDRTFLAMFSRHDERVDEFLVFGL